MNYIKYSSWDRSLDVRPFPIFAGLSKDKTLNEVYQGTIGDYTIPNQEHDRIHKELSVPFHPDVTEYTQDSSVNHSLWNHYMSNATIPLDHRKMIQGIVSAIPYRKLTKSIKLYSGIHRSPAYLAGLDWNSSRNKKIITLPSFTSSSTNLGTAIGFTKNDSKTVHHESDHHGIILPNGKHILELNLNSGEGHKAISVKDMSHLPSENEILLDHHYQFQLHARPTLINTNPKNPVYLWKATHGESGWDRPEI